MGVAGSRVVHAATGARAGNSPGARYSRQYLAKVQEQAQPGTPSGKVPGEMRSVVSLLSSVFASSTAMAMLSVALGKLVFDITDSELALGLLGLAEFAPALVLVFVTGPLADRMDRRRLAAIALGLEALVLAGLTVYVSTDPTSTLPIFLLVIGYGTARAFATPATRSLPADTVAGSRLPWLTARQAATWQGARSCSDPCSAGSSTWRPRGSRSRRRSCSWSSRR